LFAPFELTLTAFSGEVTVVDLDVYFQSVGIPKLIEITFFKESLAFEPLSIIY